MNKWLERVKKRQIEEPEKCFLTVHGGFQEEKKISGIPENNTDSVDSVPPENAHAEAMNPLIKTSLPSEMINADLSSKWQNYLLDRVKILVDHEGYSYEEAQEEIIKMNPYYQGKD